MDTRHVMSSRRSRSPLVGLQLAVLCAGLLTISSSSGGFERAVSKRQLVEQSSQTYTLSLPREVVPRSVTIRNLGEGLVVDPRLIVSGSKDWFNVASILEEILEPGQSDEEKAIAIWRFLVENRHHDTPTKNEREPHHPVRLLNVYGYGFCDDAATSFMVLAEAAGLSARVVHLADNSHVVAEVHYDGDWHMFDPDGEVYYPVGPRQVIVNVRWLQANPEIIRYYPSPVWPDNADLLDIYARGGHRVAHWYRSALDSDHAMHLVLRPGESVRRSWHNWGLHVVGRTGEEPAAFGNGRFLFEPVMRDGVFRQGAEEVTNVRSQHAAGDRWNLLLSSGGDLDPARLTYEFDSPYPVLGGKVRIVGASSGGGISGSSGIARLEMAGDSQEWLELWASDVTGEIDVEIPLNAVMRRGKKRPVYRYQLRLTYTSAAAGAEWRVKELAYEGDFQLAPHALPALEKGMNDVRYLDANEGGRKVEVVFDYTERMPIL